MKNCSLFYTDSGLVVDPGLVVSGAPAALIISFLSLLAYISASVLHYTLVKSMDCLV